MHSNGSVITEVLQKIEIVDMTQDTTATTFLILWDFSDFSEAGDYFEQVQSQFQTVRENGEFQGYQLLLSFFRMEWGTLVTTNGSLAAADVIDVDFANPITLVYYKNDDDYAAIVYDHDQYILAYVERDDYVFSDSDGSGFTSRGPQLMPFDDSGTPDILISVDNYEYY